MYAIVDIETTGGYASNNDITEVAIVLHDGSQVVEQFETLVRPETPIPYYIQVLTGIRPAMVASAPPFEAVAAKIFRMLEGHVFIAHNVNFDYSFLKHHLSLCGYNLATPKICTVRLCKRVFPGMPSYSLGNLCRSMGISIQNRHRAGGDATATVRLFEQIVRKAGREEIEKLVRKLAREQSLPPHLPKEQVEALPYTPGVYYFHNQKGKVIYVGKAKNLKYRVSSHFTHNGPGRQRQEFLRNIHGITFQSCSTELMAFILESVEIRRLWPRYNYSQKKVIADFGLYCYEDRNGYIRLVIDRKKNQLPALYTFNTIAEGHTLMEKLVTRFQLCRRMCFLRSDDQPCDESSHCLGACEQKETKELYNERVLAAIHYLGQHLPSFMLVDEGASLSDSMCILMEKGKFYGMGYVPTSSISRSLDEVKTYLTRYPENDYIRGLIYQYAERCPEKRIELS